MARSSSTAAALELPGAGDTVLVNGINGTLTITDGAVNEFGYK
jgi:hypothetical protein